MGYRSNSRTDLGGKVVFSGGNSNQGRVIFSLVGRERVNTGMEKLGTYN